ncbi:MAG: hypothetical protein ACXACR_04970, partial [Candidatus Hodarchaeales archaeon]
IPVGLLKQDKNQTNVIEMLIDTPKSISSKRMEALGIKPSMISKENVKSLLFHIKVMTDHCSNVLQQILLQKSPNIEINFYPEEFLYEHQKRHGRHILTLFSADESKLVGLVCPNEASLEFGRSLKYRQIYSKINQLLSDLRIKSLSDARATKLEDFILRGVEDFYDLGTLWLSGEIGTTFGFAKDTESVTDRIDLVIKKKKDRIEVLRNKELKRQEALEKDRLDRLQAQRILYFNDQIVKRFLERISLEVQNNLLNNVQQHFPDIFGLDQDLRKKKMQLNDIKEEIIENGKIPGRIKEIFTGLASQTADGSKENISEAIKQLEKIWKLVSEMTSDELTKTSKSSRF